MISLIHPMLSDSFEKFEALPGNIREIVEAPEKRKILTTLKESYDLPLSLLLMKLLVGEMSLDDLRTFISTQMSNPSEEENLWYVLEQNFLLPYALITGKKIAEKKRSVVLPAAAQLTPLKVKQFYDFGALVEKVLERFFEVEVGVKKEVESNPVLHTRLKNILVSHLKDVRDKMEVEHTLARSTKIGGMGFGENQISLLLELLTSEKAHLEDYVEAFQVEKKPIPLRKEKAVESSGGQLTATTEKRDTQGRVPNIGTTPTEKLSVPMQKLLSPPPAPPLSPHPPPKKKVVEKIREQVQEFRPRLVGPIEELRSLTLVDFRRLSPNPYEASKKIKERILGFLFESFQKRVLAQRAWEESEVYQLYLFLGRESLTSHKSIEEIIHERLSNGEPSLTKDEFDAIMELNNELRI